MAAIQLAEQALLNASVLTVSATATTALAGVVFNALLITRAPLQLFQSIQTSLLPHLSGLEATEGHEAFARAIRVTLLAIVAFAGAVALGLLLIGPWAMDVVFGHGYSYGRVGLAVIAVGMGFHLCAGTLQPGRAGPRPRPRGGDDVAGVRRDLRRVDGRARDRRRAGARRDRLRGSGGAAVRAAARAVPAVAVRSSTGPLPLGDGVCARRASNVGPTPCGGGKTDVRPPYPSRLPTWDDVVAIGTRLPGVEVTTSYGTPALKVAGGFMCRLRTDPDALVLRVVDLGEREALLQGQPDAFFTTPHYDGHPSVLVRLEAVDPASSPSCSRRPGACARPSA